MCPVKALGDPLATSNLPYLALALAVIAVCSDVHKFPEFVTNIIID